MLIMGPLERLPEVEEAYEKAGYAMEFMDLAAPKIPGLEEAEAAARAEAEAAAAEEGGEGGAAAKPAAAEQPETPAPPAKPEPPRMAPKSPPKRDGEAGKDAESDESALARTDEELDAKELAERRKKEGGGGDEKGLSVSQADEAAILAQFEDPYARSLGLSDSNDPNSTEVAELLKKPPRQPGRLETMIRDLAGSIGDVADAMIYFRRFMPEMTIRILKVHGQKLVRNLPASMLRENLNFVRLWANEIVYYRMLAWLVAWRRKKMRGGVYSASIFRMQRPRVCCPNS
jgi:hypothetical protein